MIEAHERGVKVTVILNGEFRTYRQEEAKKVKERHNSAVQMLTAGGVPVRYSFHITIFIGRSCWEYTPEGYARRSAKGIYWKEVDMMIVRYVIGALAGAAIGGAIGYFGKCSGST